MAASREHPDTVLDLNTAIPETELLDNNIQKGKAQLSGKTRRSRSKSNHHDSMSSMEGDDRHDRKESPLQCAHSPLHLTQGSSPFSESSQSPAFFFQSSLRGHSPENRGTSLAAPQRGRYHQLTNAPSQEALVSPSSSHSKSSLSSDGSPVYLRRNKWPETDVLVSDGGCDCSAAERGGPTVVFDKKTKRRFLDLGVTLRRSYIRVRKDKSNRLSVASREPSESPSRSSRSLVSFSWFTEGRGSFSSSGTPPSSPRTALLSFNKPCRTEFQESALSEGFSTPHTSSSSISPSTVDPYKSSHQYQTLSPSSDEPWEEASSSVPSWTPQQVCQWLKGLNMEQYMAEFIARDIDGEQLLQMNGSRLKGLGVLSSSDRSVLKQHIKDVQTAAVKERKALDKLEKKKEKHRKKDQEQQRN